MAATIATFIFILALVSVQADKSFARGNKNLIESDRRDLSDSLVEYWTGCHSSRPDDCGNCFCDSKHGWAWDNKVSTGTLSVCGWPWQNHYRCCKGGDGNNMLICGNGNTITIGRNLR